MIGLIIAGFVARQILRAKVTAAVYTANAVINLPETLDKASKAAEAKRETAAEAAREASDPQYKALKVAERAKAHAQMLEELEQIRRRVLEQDRERERQRVEDERERKVRLGAGFMLLFAMIFLIYYLQSITPHPDAQALPLVGNQNSEKNNPDIANHVAGADAATATSTGTGNSSDAPSNLDGTTQPIQSHQEYSHDNGNGTVTVYVDDSSGQVVPEGAPNSYPEIFTAGTEPTK